MSILSGQITFEQLSLTVMPDSIEVTVQHCA